MTETKISFQAAIIAFTSEFIPRMVYKYVYSPDQTMSGYYNNFSMSQFRVAEFSKDSVPSDPKTEEFGNVTICM